MPLRLIIRPALALALVLIAAPAWTQTLGARVGASVDPDQFFIGLHTETDPLVDRLRFRPNVEIGVGNDATLVAVNLEFAYHFPSRREWALYAGAGPALNIIDVNNDTRAEGGFNIMIGTEHRGGLFFEVKVGALDSPEFKIGVGYVFQRE
jgi:hypothetical protein